MAYTVTLTELRESCLEQADEEGYGYVDTARLDRLINRSYARLYAKIVAACEDDYTTFAFITTSAGGGGGEYAAQTAGNEGHALPAAFLKLRHVELYLDGKVYPVRRFMMRERHLVAPDNW